MLIKQYSDLLDLTSIAELCVNGRLSCVNSVRYFPSRL